ncbi:Variant surface glycoprotein [Trypanosoma congolense IL3000]|uniref:Variant surface glycoprotein n=1 Tax=Trypanosoma congolense (strain IL3000) TaxID=1068625 RepID=F9WAB4_TRYCI|nr:Variant surface glycoprotein [Trypanosoma congolense IL3000]
MRKTMCILEFLFFMIFFGGASNGASETLYNEEEFKQLCKILKVAEGEPAPIPDELGKFLETRKILEKLLRSTKTSMATYQKVIQLKSSDKEDAEFVSYTVKRRIANEKIKHAMEKANDVYNRMEEELIKAKKERTLARSNLVHAIYGVQVGELPKEENITDVLQNVSKASIFNRWGGNKKINVHDDVPKDPTCGATTGEGAGFTLINDFYCLCVGKDNAKAVCHEKIRGPCCCCKDCTKSCQCDNSCDCSNCNKCEGCEHHKSWMYLFDVENSKIVDVPEGWKLIREACNGTFKEAVNTTAESIQEVLDEFNKLLGNNTKKITGNSDAENESRRLVVLGYVSRMNGDYNSCTGKENAVCVDYWTVLNNRHGIVWHTFMVQAQKHLKTMDKHVKKAQQLSAMIQKLKESAEESYRNSTHGSLLWSEDKGFRKNICHLFFVFLAFLV